MSKRTIHLKPTDKVCWNFLCKNRKKSFMVQLFLMQALVTLPSCLHAFVILPKPSPVSFSSSTRINLPSISQTQLSLNFFSKDESKDVQKASKSSRNSKKDLTRDCRVRIGSNVGSGSYGTVHLCQFLNKGNREDTVPYIAKRAWTEVDLLRRSKLDNDDAEIDDIDNDLGEKEKKKNRPREKAKRCEYYFHVEQHCFQKLNSLFEDQSGTQQTIQFPKYCGTYIDQEENHPWLVFDLISRRGQDEPALTLADAIKYDWSDQHESYSSNTKSHDHLFEIYQALNLSEKHEKSNKDESKVNFTLDTVMESLLNLMTQMHSKNIVHRDVKPSNLLCDPKTNQLILMDFGSAADMDPPSNQSMGSSLFSSLGIDASGGRIGLDSKDNIVAISPIYAAPELFVQWNKSPLSFDVFSCALLFCQLLFNLLEERSDAAFHQQLSENKYDLDLWLQQEFYKAKMRPRGIEDALIYLGERPGLWNLLREMLHINPERRISSNKALNRFQTILEQKKLGDYIDVERGDNDIEVVDGAFFQSVLDSMEICDVFPPEMESFDAGISSSLLNVRKASSTNILVEDEDDNFKTALIPKMIPRPLHYIATFQRSSSLGLILSEADSNENAEDEESISPKQLALWGQGIYDAEPGEVFIKSIVEGGQADSPEFKNIFQIGDRLRGVGDLPFLGGGFENVVTMLSNQPKNAKTVKLQFDRKSALLPDTISMGDSDSSASDEKKKNFVKPTGHNFVKIADQGAYSVRGRRKTQEDAFVLHEMNDMEENPILIAGVFDGHGGNAASTTASQLLPSLVSAQLAASKFTPNKNSEKLTHAFQSAWETTCQTYQGGCNDEDGACVADYDPVEGIIMGHVGSQDLVAGTTASVILLKTRKDDGDKDKEEDDFIIVLNCGDSRTLLFQGPSREKESSSVVQFCTRDHSPKDEKEGLRLKQGKDQGLDYSLPECSSSRWWLTIGDYQYAVSRSLEGEFAFSKGIVYDADVTMIPLSSNEERIIMIASDGVFEVMDNEEVGRDLLSMRDAGICAGDAAKNICGAALDKGTSDNVSVVIIYLS